MQSIAKTLTRLKRFPAELNRLLLWKALIDLIDPQNPKSSPKCGCTRYPLLTMLRFHLLQQWYVLSGSGLVDSLIKMLTISCFELSCMISELIFNEIKIPASALAGEARCRQADF